MDKSVLSYIKVSYDLYHRIFGCRYFTVNVWVKQKLGILFGDALSILYCSHIACFGGVLPSVWPIIGETQFDQDQVIDLAIQKDSTKNDLITVC